MKDWSHLLYPHVLEYEEMPLKTLSPLMFFMWCVEQRNTTFLLETVLTDFRMAVLKNSSVFSLQRRGVVQEGKQQSEINQQLLYQIFKLSILSITWTPLLFRSFSVNEQWFCSLYNVFGRNRIAGDYLGVENKYNKKTANAVSHKNSCKCQAGEMGHLEELQLRKP